jgi:hypothetical protein
MTDSSKQRLIKGSVTFTFVGILAVHALFNHFSGNSLVKEQAVAFETAMNRYGFFLQEVSKQSGVDFVHHSPALDPLIEPILPQIASMGASVSISDFNNDGWNDIYVTNSAFEQHNALYLNRKDGTFIDVAGEMGVADLNREGKGVSMGAVWADYDNDGYEDLFVYRWGRPALFRNNNGTGFEEVTGESGFPAWINANTAIWLDYNSDGYTDLFIGGYFREDIDLWNLKSPVFLTESFEYSENGGRNYLFRNNGTGGFTDVTHETGLTSTRWTLAAGSADINGDGFPELIIANDYATDEFYFNDAGKNFSEIGKNSMIGFSPKSGMNVSFGDTYNNGKFGIYISNITEDGILLQGNNFWVPYESSEKVVYINAAGQLGIENGGWSYGAQFGDLNNDGFIDLYVANGYISGEPGTSYWYDYSKVTGGNAAIISDIRNWPAMKGRSQSGFQQDRIWINNGSGRFSDAAGNKSDPENLDSRAVAFADLWNRGTLDIIVANQNNRLLLYKNNINPGNHWIAFELEGTTSNRSAINAIVKLYWDSNMQSQVVTGGIGFCSQNQRRVHFGLGKSAVADRVEITWPDGHQQVIENPGIDRLHTIIESR